MKFREFITSSGKKVLAGKSAKNNEELIEQVEDNEVVLHTAEPGSPFVNIKGRATKKDIKEVGAFCARYSQDWRNNKNDVDVHVFKGKNIYKKQGMKIGTFGVRKFEVIKMEKHEITKFEKKNG